MKKFLLAVSNENKFAIELKWIREIAPEREIMKVPGSRDELKGLFFFRGDVIPVIELNLNKNSEQIMKENFSGKKKGKVIILKKTEELGLEFKQDPCEICDMYRIPSGTSLVYRPCRDSASHNPTGDMTVSVYADDICDIIFADSYVQIQPENCRWPFSLNGIVHSGEITGIIDRKKLELP